MPNLPRISPEITQPNIAVLRLGHAPTEPVIRHNHENLINISHCLSLSTYPALAFPLLHDVYTTTQHLATETENIVTKVERGFHEKMETDRILDDADLHVQFGYSRCRFLEHTCLKFYFVWI